MQITLVSSGDTVSDVLNRFETNFFKLNEIEEEFSRWTVPISGFLIERSIRELKAMTDFLATSFTIADLEAPKRNSKASLADWIAQVLLSTRKVLESSEAIADQVTVSASPEIEVTMQITLVSSGDTVSDVLDKFVSLFCVNESELNSITDSQYLALRSSICELKEIADFLLNKFAVDLTPPKRNSKVSLAGWIAQVVFSAREVVKPSEAISDQVVDAECPDCGFVHEPGQNTLCPNGEPIPHIVDPNSEVEVLEPEEKPVYRISIITDGAFSEERVNRLPPFLIDRKGNLLKKFWHRSYDAGYSEITSKHLSNIAVNSGLVVKLMTDSLKVSQACIVGDPPPFIVDKGGAYKRDQVKRGLAVSYSQVVSEYLSNIVVV